LPSNPGHRPFSPENVERKAVPSSKDGKEYFRLYPAKAVFMKFKLLKEGEQAAEGGRGADIVNEMRKRHPGGTDTAPMVSLALE